MAPQPKPSLKRRLEDHLRALPSLPTVVAQLMTLDREDESYFDKLLAILESDPNLSARVLASANSAASGSRSSVVTLRSALGRVGSQAASNLVLALAMTHVFVPRDSWEKSLWRHSIQVATAARALARCCEDAEVDPDEAYTCGLLHDIGRFVMFQEAPEELRVIDEADWDNCEGLQATEREICGLTHSELGALACRQWSIPEAIAEIVQEHHAAPQFQPQSPSAMLRAVVQLADFVMFPSAMPGTPGLEEADDDTLQSCVLERLPGFLSLDLPGLRELLQEVKNQANATAESLGVV